MQAKKENLPGREISFYYFMEKREMQQFREAAPLPSRKGDGRGERGKLFGGALLPFVNVPGIYHRFAPPLPSTDADHFLHRIDEDYAVAGLSGIGGPQDGVKGLF